MLTKMNKLLAFMLVCMVYTGTVSASDKIYKAGNFVCNKCPPGMRVDKHCKKHFTNSTCVPCPPHQFMDVWNGKKDCNACVIADCPPNGQEVQNCTSTTNRLCLCLQGHHKSHVDTIDVQFTCKEHAKCGPGEGVVSYGNNSHDTQCENCRDGRQFVNTWDPKRPKCQSCSVCPLGSQVVTNCMLTADTLCVKNSTETGTTSDPLHGDGDGGLGGGAIAAIVICILLLVIAIIVGLMFYWKRRQSMHCWSKKEEDGENGSPADEPML